MNDKHYTVQEIYKEFIERIEKFIDLKYVTVTLDEENKRVTVKTDTDTLSKDFNHQYARMAYEAVFGIGAHFNFTERADIYYVLIDRTYFSLTEKKIE